MDRLRRDELEATRATPLEEKASRARDTTPRRDAEEIEAMLQAWLDADDD